jgi:hypothetical protein
MSVAAKASESTALNLLTREGAVSATFSAMLTTPQYAKLFGCIQEHSESRLELKERIAMLANEWGIDAMVRDG